MRFIYKIMILFCLLASCVGCETELKKAPLPSFDKQIEPNENILFFDDDPDEDGFLNEIIAFDTKESKILYKYVFDEKKFDIYYADYDYETDKNNIYIVFTDGRVAKLDVSTGKMYEFENIELIRKPESLAIFNNEVWVSPNCPGFKNRPVKYFVYTPATNTSRYEELPEGILFYSTPFEMSSKVFLPLFDVVAIYNYTDKEMLDISSLDDDVTYKNDFAYVWHDYYNGFLASEYRFSASEDSERATYEVSISKIKSVVPKLEVDKLFDIPEIRVRGIYETEKYLFVFGVCEGCFLVYAKDDNYKLEKSIPLNTHGSSLLNNTRDDFFYCVKDDTHGIYKISLQEPFTVEEIHD